MQQQQPQGEKRVHSAGSDEPKRQRASSPPARRALFLLPKVKDATQVSSHRLTQLFAVVDFLAEGGYGVVLLVRPTRSAIESGALQQELKDREFVLKVERETGDESAATEATVYALLQRSACPRLNVGRAYYWTRVHSDNLLAELRDIDLRSRVAVEDVQYYARPHAYSITLQERLSGPTLTQLYDSSEFKLLTAYSRDSAAVNATWSARAAAALACIVVPIYAQLNIIRRCISPDFTHRDLHTGNVVGDSTGMTRDHWVLYEQENGVLVVPLFVTDGAVLRIIDFGTAMGSYSALYADGTVHAATIHSGGGMQTVRARIDAVAFVLSYIASLKDKLHTALHQSGAAAETFVASVAQLVSVLHDAEYNSKRVAVALRRLKRLIATLEALSDVPTLLDTYAEVLAGARVLALVIDPMLTTVVAPAFERAGKQADFARASAAYTQARLALERSDQARLFAAVYTIQQIKENAHDDSRDPSLLAPDFYARLLDGPVAAALRTANNADAIRTKQLELVSLFQSSVARPYSGTFTNIVVQRPPAEPEQLAAVESRVK